VCGLDGNFRDVMFFSFLMYVCIFTLLTSYPGIVSSNIINSRFNYDSPILDYQLVPSSLSIPYFLSKTKAYSSVIQGNPYFFSRFSIPVSTSFRETPKKLEFLGQPAYALLKDTDSLKPKTLIFDSNKIYLPSFDSVYPLHTLHPYYIPRYYFGGPSFSPSAALMNGSGSLQNTIVYKGFFFFFFFFNFFFFFINIDFFFFLMEQDNQKKNIKGRKI
jgi:hypothetical protein